LPDGGIWSHYWHYDRIASCFDDAGRANYADEIAGGWRAFFGALPDGARILDLCTGNGAVALIAAETARESERNFRIVAVDQADIDPAAHVSRHERDYGAIIFLRDTEVETLPFPSAGFSAVISQYGLEYSNLERSLPEAVRMVAPGGKLRLVVHAADGRVSADSRKVIAEADLLLDEIGLTDAARRCYTALAAVERDPAAGEEAQREANAAFAVFQAALERTARQIPNAEDQAMFKNSGAVLLDCFQRRDRFELDQLLRKADEVESEIVAHRGRLRALVGAALDRSGVETLAKRLSALGAAACAAQPLVNAAGLVGHVVEAGF
jgi:ubiquinone/menaquinone biosynthesis C-methylase UbiE